MKESTKYEIVGCLWIGGIILSMIGLIIGTVGCINTCFLNPVYIIVIIACTISLVSLLFFSCKYKVISSL